MDDVDHLSCQDVVCARSGHYDCHDMPRAVGPRIRPRVHPLLEDIKRGAHQRKVAEMKRERGGEG